MKYYYSLFLFLTSAFVHSQVPKYGNDTLLDIACWNIEWFGDTQFGPTDEPLQLSNVAKVIKGAGVDVWSLEEVSHPNAWASLTNQLTDYDNAIVTYGQTQKTALLWRKDMFAKISEGMVLNTGSCDCSYEFANGRYPFEVVLRTLNQPVSDTLYFYVIHLKATGGSTATEDYNRRKAAAGLMKSFFDTQRAGKKVVVLGDWNDELVGSTVGSNASPFDNLQNDTARYFFITRQLSDQFKKSYASSNGRMLDHIMISRAMKPLYVPASSRVLDQLPAYVSGYTQNTSDHYPVMGYFNLNRPAMNTATEEIADELALGLFPNPTLGGFTIGDAAKVVGVEVIDLLGREIDLKTYGVDDELRLEFPSTAANGLYIVIVKTASGSSVGRIRLAR
jgi:endonuclease/exonuclease/phosphatase family metal-dependent hydrolase